MKKSILSVCLFFSKDTLTGLAIYHTPDTISYDGIQKKRKSYGLRYEGAKYMLAREFPVVHRLINTTDLVKETLKLIIDKEAQFGVLLTLTETGTYFFFREKSSPLYTPRAKPEKLKELVETLNVNYHSRDIYTRDSVLIFQTVVESDGTYVGEMELIHGDKDALYDYFMGTYDYYMKHILTRTIHRARLYQGGIKDRPWRGVIELFVRLNPDNTFTVSVTDVGRSDMKLKNYKQDPKKPIFYF